MYCYSSWGGWGHGFFGLGHGIWGLLLMGLLVYAIFTALRPRHKAAVADSTGFCPGCGSGLRTEWKHCPNCGSNARGEK